MESGKRGMIDKEIEVIFYCDSLMKSLINTSLSQRMLDTPRQENWQEKTDARQKRKCGRGRCVSLISAASPLHCRLGFGFSFFSGKRKNVGTIHHFCTSVMII